jgi:hypothetical protein
MSILFLQYLRYNIVTFESIKDIFQAWSVFSRDLRSQHPYYFDIYLGYFSFVEITMHALDLFYSLIIAFIIGIYI